MCLSALSYYEPAFTSVNKSSQVQYTVLACYATFYIFRKYQDELFSESLLGDPKNQDRGTDTRYVPLKPISLGDNEQPSTNSNTT